MKCKRCGEKLILTSKDRIAIEDDNIIRRYAGCYYCLDINIVEYTNPEVISSYEVNRS